MHNILAFPFIIIMNVADNRACVTFGYSMYGDGVGSLQVLTKTEHGTPRQVWVQSGNKGQAWHRAEIDINMNNTFYQVCCSDNYY